uniref:Uncharacterized protein n=1 Tax=Heterorhabditis bacteriophora TaxID=37862 RepID=A0A1I7X195_HETBA
MAIRSAMIAKDVPKDPSQYTPSSSPCLVVVVGEVVDVAEVAAAAVEEVVEVEVEAAAELRRSSSSSSTTCLEVVLDMLKVVAVADMLKAEAVEDTPRAVEAAGTSRVAEEEEEEEEEDILKVLHRLLQLHLLLLVVEVLTPIAGFSKTDKGALDKGESIIKHYVKTKYKD